MKVEVHDARRETVWDERNTALVVLETSERTEIIKFCDANCVVRVFERTIRPGIIWWLRPGPLADRPIRHV